MQKILQRKIISPTYKKSSIDESPLLTKSLLLLYESKKTKFNIINNNNNCKQFWHS